jgi:hypothetical protein
LLQSRQQFQSQQVTLAPRFQIGLILPEGKIPVFKIRGNFMAVAFQKGSNHSVVAAGRHAGKAALTRTAKDSEQDFFSLIVSVVAQGKLVGALIGHNLLQTSIAKLPGSHLQ